MATTTSYKASGIARVEGMSIVHLNGPVKLSLPFALRFVLPIRDPVGCLKCLQPLFGGFWFFDLAFNSGGRVCSAGSSK